MAYKVCPTCGGKGVNMERSPTGSTTCENGHKYSHANFRPRHKWSKIEPGIREAIDILMDSENIDYDERIEEAINKLHGLLGL
tara:strand:- start:1204 stop:1452 length:249 start_codon:yes stop_codon:yes gene_type:complete